MKVKILPYSSCKHLFKATPSGHPSALWGKISTPPRTKIGGSFGHSSKCIIATTSCQARALRSLLLLLLRMTWPTVSMRAWNSRVAFPLARQRTGLRGGLREKLCFHVATLHTDTALWEQQTCRRDFFPTSTTPSLCTNTFSAFHRPYGEVFPSTHARGSERTNWNTCTADKFRCPILKLLLCDWILEFPVVAVLVSMAQWTPLSVPHP